MENGSVGLLYCFLEFVGQSFVDAESLLQLVGFVHGQDLVTVYSPLVDGASQFLHAMLLTPDHQVPWWVHADTPRPPPRLKVHTPGISIIILEGRPPFTASGLTEEDLCAKLVAVGPDARFLLETQDVLLATADAGRESAVEEGDATAVLLVSRRALGLPHLLVRVVSVCHSPGNAGLSDGVPGRVAHGFALAAAPTKQLL